MAKYLNKAGLQYFYNQLKAKGIGLSESDIVGIFNRELAKYKESLVTIVTVLPETGTEGFIYLLPSGDSSTVFTVYFWEDNAWRPSGSVTIDLSNYYTKSEVDTKFNDYIKSSDLVALTESEIDEVMQ